LQGTLDLGAEVWPSSCPQGNTDQDFLGSTIMLYDAALQAQGAQRVTHHPEVRRLTEAQLQEGTAAEVNPLIHTAAPDNRRQTDEDDDSRDAYPDFRFPDKIDLQSWRN
jgi:hypothetical protein